jgi:hypothetical protein
LTGVGLAATHLRGRTAWAAREAARTAEPAGAAGAAAKRPPGFENLADALGDEFPLGIICCLELLAHTFHYALAHLLRVEIARGAILGRKVSGAAEQPGGRSEGAKHSGLDE